MLSEIIFSKNLTLSFCHIHLKALSGYHVDTPITIKAEAIHQADSRSH